MPIPYSIERNNLNACSINREMPFVRAKGISLSIKSFNKQPTFLPSVYYPFELELSTFLLVISGHFHRLNAR